jgi:hypothetical protein
MCTTRFNIQKFYILSTDFIYVFCAHLRTNTIISLYSINWLVFIIETEIVYCVVRTRATHSFQTVKNNLPFDTEKHITSKSQVYRLLSEVIIQCYYKYARTLLLSGTELRLAKLKTGICSQISTCEVITKQAPQNFPGRAIKISIV